MPPSFNTFVVFGRWLPFDVGAASWAGGAVLGVGRQLQGAVEEKDGEAKEAPIKSKKLSKEGEGINVSCKSDGSKNAEVKSQDDMELTSGEQLNGGDAGTKKAMSQWTKTKKDTLQIGTMIMNPKMRIMRESVR